VAQEGCSGYKSTSEQRVARKEMSACVRGVIEDLPGDYRTTILLKELEGLKNKEIAKLLGVTLDTVKIRSHRARQRLKRELEALCQLYHDERNELVCEPKAIFQCQ
jgi:RNA polymerase sigma-70 factor (ECF subfamily)